MKNLRDEIADIIDEGLILNSDERGPGMGKATRILSLPTGLEVVKKCNSTIHKHSVINQETCSICHGSYDIVRDLTFQEVIEVAKEFIEYREACGGYVDLSSGGTVRVKKGEVK